MTFAARMALLLIAVLVAALTTTGLSSVTGAMPQAQACEKHEKGGGHKKCPPGKGGGAGSGGSGSGGSGSGGGSGGGGGVVPPPVLGCAAGEAHGSGVFPTREAFSFDACQPSADVHTGTGFFEASPDYPREALSCVDVEGNRVGMGYTPQSGPYAGKYYVFTATDGGTDTQDALIGFVGNDPADGCMPVNYNQPINSGSITVTDRLPVPTAAPLVALEQSLKPSTHSG